MFFKISFSSDEISIKLEKKYWFRKNYYNRDDLTSE